MWSKVWTAFQVVTWWCVYVCLKECFSYSGNEANSGQPRRIPGRKLQQNVGWVPRSDACFRRPVPSGPTSAESTMEGGMCQKASRGTQAVFTSSAKSSRASTFLPRVAGALPTRRFVGRFRRLVLRHGLRIRLVSASLEAASVVPWYTLLSPRRRKPWQKTQLPN